MSELGTRLREARERQGLSLAQAAMDTRILQQSLAALEEGAFQRLPGDVVIRGFIRNYSQYLGLSSDELIELYRRERGVTDQIRVVPATNPPRSRAYVMPSFFGVFFVTVALVGLSYIALNAVGRVGDRVTPAAGALATATIPPPSPLPTTTPGLAPTLPPRQPTPIPAIAGNLTRPTVGVSTPTRTTAVAGGITAPPTASATPAAPIVLELAVPGVRGDENSWVRVQTDGNTAFEGVLRAGENLTFAAQRRVLVRAGNPPDVLVTVNGLQQGPLGPNPGQPVNWTWPPN